ncbi:MAG: hypothetical protein OEY01_07075 [Desulfobulbaceae bacterium]|nr:hypothetical protein [Desulfobulbaceae bacterium]HIJ78818.1 hypothetical protein [Deltaproteobacteria bacterium]
MEQAIKMFIICLASIVPVGGLIYLAASIKSGKIITREPSKLLVYKTVSRKEDQKAFWVSWSAIFIFFMAMFIFFVFLTVSKWDLPIESFVRL